MRLKLLFIGVALFVVCGRSYGQTTITSDGLNNSTTLFSLSNGAYYTGNSASGDRPASSPFAAEGTYSRGISNGSATLLSNDINTTNYTSVFMTMKLATFSINSTGNGADGTDIVTVEVSPDGGITYYSTVRVLGNNNAYWAYTAIGNASTAYDGNITPTDFFPAGGGSRTTDGYSTVTITGLPSVAALKIRITMLNNAANEQWVLDDFKIQGTVATPSVTISATSLTGFTYGEGSGPSQELSYTVSGMALTNDITITAPTNYEISTTSGNSFANSLTLTQTSGVVSTTTIYVRLKSSLTTNASYTGTITNVSSGAPQKDVSCSGSVTNVVTWGIVSTNGGTILLGQTYNVSAQCWETGITDSAGNGGVSAWIGFSSNSSNPNTGTWTWVAAPYSGDLGNDDVFTVDLGTVIPATGSYNFVARFQIGSGAYVCGGYNSGFWDGSINITPVLTVNPHLVDWANLQSAANATIFQGSTFNAYGQVFESGVTNINATQGTGITVGFGISPIGTNSNPNTWTNWTTTTYNNSCLSCGDFDFNGIPDNDEYSATTGAALAVGTYYYTFRYSLNGGPYMYGGYTTVGGGFWNGTTDISGVLTVSGIPTITVSTTAITGFTYVSGNGPSANQNFTVSGTYLTANLVLTAPTNYEICLTSGGIYTSSLSLTPTSETVATTTIYVRLKTGLIIGTYNLENIVMTSTSATTKNLACSGTVTRSLTSDIIPVASSESATVSSLENDATITTTADGTQVWQFTIRDGGASSDADNLATIVNSVRLTQATGNEIQDWGDAIQAVALFNGTTKIVDGIVTSTDITFTGAPLISVPDNGSVTLTVRLSVQTNPNNSGFNTDGDDFQFSIDHSYLTESASGSQFKPSGAVSSTNGQNVLSVIATKFLYTEQPTATGVNTLMSPVIITAVDANGNIDLGFTGVVSITSTGTMTGTTLTTTAVAGIATFSGIIHAVMGTGFTLNATATGITALISLAFDIVSVTTLAPGDVAILAVNTTAATSSTEDEISFVCFVDILPGTTFYLTDNGYERVYAGKWGNTEGIVSLTRKISTLPKGSIITIHSIDNGINDGTDFTVYTCGVVDTNWTKGVVSGSSYKFDLNKDDQVWIMQGGVWGNVGTGNHDATYSGNVLYGWTDIAWKTAVNYSSTQGSTLYPKRECYTTDVANPETGAAQVKFNDPNILTTTTNGRFDWISLINNPLNWNYYTSDANYDSGGYNYFGATACPAMTIDTDVYINGKWTGKKDTNWFNCGNWNTLAVPDETVDVQVGDNTFNNQATVDNTATNASYYGNIAKTKNLTITGEKVEVVASVNNKLEVHGNLSINTSGALDMDDGNNSTSDGQLYLYGNWTNSIGISAFEEGNGTVQFLGTSPQIINISDHTNPEQFYNVVLDNNFDTSVSNNLIANGNLDINSGKTLTVKTENYAQVTNNLTVNGNLTVEDKGSLVMINDLGTVTNNGTTNIHRQTSPFETNDYIYWSTPIVSTFIDATFTNLPSFPTTWHTENAYEFLPANFVDADDDGFDDNHDDWSFVTSMSPGKGYIIMVPYRPPPTPLYTQAEVVFSGEVNNGIVPSKIFFTGTVVDPPDDDWNLVGNPYPSAISADSFITQNLSNISGTLYFWTHKWDLSTSNPGPDAYNYAQADYAVYTLAGGVGVGAGSDSGSTAPLGYIASGQGFFVEAENNNVDLIFNNSMRSNLHSNSQFFKSRPGKSKLISKDRLWLNMENSLGAFSQQLIGYFDNTTLSYDKGYDGLLNDGGNNINFYSFIDNDNYKIQGRSAFDENDQVRLGYFSAVAGTFNINIDSKEGVFTNLSTSVYLEDKLLNVIYDLKQSPYTFTTEKGTFNDRFILRYTNKTLGTNDLATLENQVLVSNKNKQIKINSAVETIDKVTVYDLLGRQLFKKEKVNSNELSILNLISSQQTLLVKVTLQNGQTATKKIIY